MQSMFISHLARSDSKVTIEISWNIMMCILWVNDVEFLDCISLAGIESVLGFLGWMHLYYLLWLRLVGTRWGVTESKPTPNSSTFNRIQSTYRPYRYVSKLKGRNLGGFPPNTSRILRHIHLLQTDKCRGNFPEIPCSSKRFAAKVRTTPWTLRDIFPPNKNPMPIVESKDYPSGN